MKYWEIIADNLSKSGWTWGCVSAVDSRGRTIWITDAHYDDGASEQSDGDQNTTRNLDGLRDDLPKANGVVEVRLESQVGDFIVVLVAKLVDRFGNTVDRDVIVK